MNDNISLDSVDMLLRHNKPRHGCVGALRGKGRGLRPSSSLEDAPDRVVAQTSTSLSGFITIMRLTIGLKFLDYRLRLREN
jgi:hypothetical protein